MNINKLTGDMQDF